MKIFIIALALTATFASSKSLAADNCFIQGTYSLQIDKFNSPSLPLNITGYINTGISTTYINWKAQLQLVTSTASYYIIDGSYKGEWLKLNLAISTLRYDITGIIHGRSIFWSSMNNWVSGYQDCIL